MLSVSHSLSIASALASELDGGVAMSSGVVCFGKFLGINDICKI
jgi:hypothetical protein